MKKLPWAVASYAFSYMLLFILIGLLVGVFIFYQYIVSVELYQPETAHETVQFQYDTYKKVINDWQINQQALQPSADQKLLNPFTPAP